MVYRKPPNLRFALEENTLRIDADSNGPHSIPNPLRPRRLHQSIEAR
jgi:hypothetical protein